MTSALRIALVVGSTREGRFGPRIADWFKDFADGRGDVALDAGGAEKAATAMLDDLVWWGNALLAARRRDEGRTGAV
ncbi:hypothetical protein LG634_26590 [Streptomyces bambusae]|uniref:hypothetical protein n=1 Tax=Streptomyces bambusae TaxID=1550616 RepID=UPI001CFE9C52|nr:hypothetical protein [Streptomyces bambusae]MCB5168378.1 hypothetical protein [Streptomyces bambusae]